MPYISPQRRTELDSELMPENAGEINYLVSCLISEFFALKGTNYETINTAIGALECAKLELYRRIAAPYEDVKLAENGDVYTVAEN